jgi:predicted transcriptional regulator
MQKSKITPTNSELEILTILWTAGMATTRQVHDELAKTKDTGYTTTLKIIQNMYDKKMLSREAKGQTHIYKPVLQQADVQQQLLGGFVNKVFMGSSKNLILQALGNEKPSKDELNEIRAMLDKLDKGASE